MDNSGHDKFGLSPKILHLIKKIFLKYPQITQVLIYGSRAKGSHKLSSDIDLTLKGHDISIEILLKVENELDDLFLPYKFDVSIYHQITDYDMLEHINRAGKVFYEPKNTIL